MKFSLAISFKKNSPLNKNWLIMLNSENNFDKYCINGNIKKIFKKNGILIVK